jgi:hypothetical protein
MVRIRGRCLDVDYRNRANKVEWKIYSSIKTQELNRKNFLSLLISRQRLNDQLIIFVLNGQKRYSLNRDWKKHANFKICLLFLYIAKWIVFFSACSVIVIFEYTKTHSNC